MVGANDCHFYQSNMFIKYIMQLIKLAAYKVIDHNVTFPYSFLVILSMRTSTAMEICQMPPTFFLSIITVNVT